MAGEREKNKRIYSIGKDSAFMAESGTNKKLNSYNKENSER